MRNKINQASMLRKGTMLRGIYRIDRYLSSGGFGNTYVVTNMEFDEVWAIKEFFIKGVTQRDNNTSVSVSNSDNNELFETQLEKFKKEARRIRKLKNDHIVGVYDLFEENGTAYYVMDYIDGESLAERMDRLKRPLAESEVLRYYPQILDALLAVHQQGILHLDLKPGNIMVDAQGNVKLIDFGASKQHNNTGGSNNENSTLICYTNGYAPREQMERNFEKIGPWTDIYALGATLYALLTNQCPPMPSNIDDDHSADKHVALPFPADVSDETRNLILRLMKTDRNDRPQSVEELLNEDGDEETLIIPVALKKFEGWKEKLRGFDYYQGYYTTLETSLEKLKNAKSNAVALAVHKKAKKAYADLQESASLYKRFFSLNDYRDSDGVSYDWSLVNDKLKHHDTSMKNEDLKALIEKFEASKKEIPYKPGKDKGFFDKRSKQLLLGVLGVVVVVFLLSFFFRPKSNNHISKEDLSQLSEVIAPKDTVLDVVKDMCFSVPTMGEGLYSGVIDEQGMPHDSSGVFTITEKDIEYRGTFIHGVADGKASYKIQGQTFIGLFKNNEYAEGKLTDSSGAYFEGSFKGGQPYNGAWYTPSGQKDSKVVYGKEIR